MPVASKNSIGSDSQPVGMHKQSSELVEYHRIIAEIDYHGMEAVLKPRMKVSKSRSTAAEGTQCQPSSCSDLGVELFQIRAPLSFGSVLRKQVK